MVAERSRLVEGVSRVNHPSDEGLVRLKFRMTVGQRFEVILPNRGRICYPKRI
jgi:hypothetical protein